jgi:signal transduction histidine kinase
MSARNLPEIAQESLPLVQPLSDFVRTHHTEIIDQFEAFASTFESVASVMTSAELRDHAEELLAAIVADLAEPQSAPDELRKSHGQGTRNAMQASGNLHADARIRHRFNAAQVIAEFRALRASVLRLYEESGGPVDLPGVRRFNEAIDEALTASMIRFSEGVDRYRDQFIGVLGHDLRTPLGAITSGASLLTMPTCDDAQRARVGAMILTSARRMADMIADLMDLTRFRLGAGVLVDRAPADLGDICQSVVLEVRALHPSAVILYDRVGELRGSWDGSRLAQVAANLIGNALEHGTPGAPIHVTATGLPEHASLRVHNTGATIPLARRAAIFEPMVRYTCPGEQTGGGIGLGLFIVRSIVLAHGGTVEMTSSDADGTTFEVVLPRN